MKARKWALAASAAAALVATPAFATSSANASLTNFTVTLYSLSPNQNFVPTITFDNSVTAYGYAYAVDYGNNFAQSNSSSGVGSLSANTAASHASSSMNGSLNSTGIPVSIGSSGSSSGSVGALSNSSYFQSYNYLSAASFTLSANTFAVFKATGSATAQTTVGYDATTGQSENSYAQTYLQVSGSNGYSGSQSSTDQIYLGATNNAIWDPVTNNYLYSGQNVTQSGTLQVSFGNTTANSLTGALYVQTLAYGSSGIAAVPEPETYGMLLAGLGLIGAIAKRRKAKQA